MEISAEIYVIMEQPIQLLFAQQMGGDAQIHQILTALHQTQSIKLILLIMKQMQLTATAHALESTAVIQLNFTVIQQILVQMELMNQQHISALTMEHII